MKLNKEQETEVNRLEERSLFFLKYFSIFWFTLIFFFIQELNKNELAKKISTNFIKSIINNSNLQNILSSISFIILLALIPITIIFLAGNSVNSRLTYKNAKNFINHKLDLLISGVRYGFFASLLLVFYLIYLYNLDNPVLVDFFNLFDKWLASILVILTQFLGPTVSLFKNFCSWKSVRLTLTRLSEILGIVFSIFYLRIAFPPEGGIQINEMVSIMLILFVFSGFIYNFAVYFTYFLKLFWKLFVNLVDKSSKK